MNLGVSCQLKNIFLEHYSKYFNDLLSGERSLPFGLLVSYFSAAITVLVCLNSSAIFSEIKQCVSLSGTFMSYSKHSDIALMTFRCDRVLRRVYLSHQPAAKRHAPAVYASIPHEIQPQTTHNLITKTCLLAAVFWKRIVISTTNPSLPVIYEARK